MVRVNKTPQDFILAIHNALKKLERDRGFHIVGVSIDWQDVDAIPYQNGYFDGEHDCFLIIEMPLKVISDKGNFKDNIVVQMSATNMLAGQQFYTRNPFISRELPKKFMFVQEDYRTEVMQFIRDNFDFTNGFYSINPNGKPVIKHIEIQESFDLNLHYLLSAKFNGTLPFIASADSQLEVLFTVYHGYWLHTLKSLQYVKSDIERYRKNEIKLLTACEGLEAPYTVFKANMDKEYRSKFIELVTRPNTPPRRYMLDIQLNEQKSILFLSAYVGVCVNLENLKVGVIYDQNSQTSKSIVASIEFLGLSHISRLIGYM